MKKILLFVFCFSIVAKAQEKDLVLGKIITLHSSVLNEDRTINLYLPEDYSKNNALYPILYVLDGSTNEDFIHIVGIVQFLTMSDLMPKTIVAGIANVDRRRDFTFPTTIVKDKKDYPTTGSSARFIEFINKEMLPFMKSHYRLGSSTIIGQSLGGLLLAEILAEHPDLFHQYLIVSPSLWWDNESLLDKIEKAASDNPVSAYIMTGKEGKIMEGDAQKLAGILTSKRNFDIHHFNLPEENHATILHVAVYKALREIYRKKE